MLDSYRDLIDGLLVTPNALRDALGTPVPADLAPEKTRLLRELRVREAINLRRIQAIMRQERILIRAMEDEPEIQGMHDAPADPEVDLAAFSHDRSELISLLVNLTLKDWERPVDHDRSGDTTLAVEIEEHLTWDEEIAARLTG